MSLETREKMRQSHLGLKHTEEGKLKIAEAHRGKKRPPFSEEWKANMSLGMKGRIFSEEHRKNLSLSGLGRKMSEEQKIKLSIIRTGKPQLNQRGDKNHNWKGGITKINVKIRTSLEYRIWRRTILERDDYTCKLCGLQSKKGRFNLMEVDHIKPFAYYPELRFDLDNGRTLCISCHKQTDTYKYNARTLLQPQ